MGKKWKFALFDYVEKHSGDVTGFGTIVSRYSTLRGKQRYVVEVDPQGFQMIWTEAQLRKAEKCLEG